MSHRISNGATSTFLQDSSRDLISERYVKSDNLKNFLILSAAFTNTCFNFDMFSGITQVTLFVFIFGQMTVGMSYMFMDSFIKLYTGKIDVNKTLNPLLKGVAYGALLQTLLWSLIHANDLADAINYFLNSFKFFPPWSRCGSNLKKYPLCKPTKDILFHCARRSYVNINVTSTHLHYLNIFGSYERSVLTTKMFLVVMVWIFNFIFSSVPDVTLIKLFKLIYYLRLTTTMFSAAFIIISLPGQVSPAVGNIMNVSAPVSFTDTFAQMAYIYGIGIVGVYDFGTLSPYTCVDNAVLLFSAVFTLSAMLRSLVTRMLYLVLTRCVRVDLKGKSNIEKYHYLIFVLLPLASESLKATKVFSLYLYFYIILTLVGHLAAFTMTMSRILHSEFKSIHNIYIVGIISFCGCGLSIPVSLMKDYWSGMLNGLNLAMFYLGTIRVAIIMYMYGIKKFSTDIQFWLNFKPTGYWRACWGLTPIILAYVVGLKFGEIRQEKSVERTAPAYIWFGLIAALVALIHVKTVTKFIAANNLTAAFRSSQKYGPPDIDERKLRKNFDDTVNLRICRHNCTIMDDKFDCNHMPLMRKEGTEASEDSITSIFEATPSVGKLWQSIHQTEEGNNHNEYNE